MFDMLTFEEKHHAEIDQRARNMIEEGKIDFFEMHLFQKGEIGFEEIYPLAYEIASEDLRIEMERHYD